MHFGAHRLKRQPVVADLWCPLRRRPPRAIRVDLRPFGLVCVGIVLAVPPSTTGNPVARIATPYRRRLTKNKRDNGETARHRVAISAAESRGIHNETAARQRRRPGPCHRTAARAPCREQLPCQCTARPEYFVRHHDGAVSFHSMPTQPTRPAIGPPASPIPAGRPAAPHRQACLPADILGYDPDSF
jgi:hypothetical protein